MNAVRPVVKKSVVKHPPCARPRDNHCVRLSGPAKLGSFTRFWDRSLDNELAIKSAFMTVLVECQHSPLDEQRSIAPVGNSGPKLKGKNLCLEKEKV